MTRPPEDTLEVCGLHVVGISQGGVETNIRVPELKLMFDLGMIPHGALRFNRVLASHGHNDHLAGIHYYISQRKMMSLRPAIIHVPEEIAEPLETVLGAWSQIEGFEYEYELRPTKPGDRCSVGRDLTATAIRTKHRVPSLAWAIERTTRKLDDAFRGRSPEQLAALRAQGVEITHETVTPLLCVTGDTTIDTFLDSELMRRCKVLVHECTAWDQQRDVASTRAYGHTHVDEIIEHVEKFEGEALVLVHRSLRHSRAFAESVVKDRFPASVRDKVFVFGND
ncbi:Metal-dependent hydrolase of the beta-lactamase superfamily III [Enhygromyxa salina]|uniref:Metal-dependent hydrolase of the beta-lactamase superfamily III n=1 Tax=Enhygromyxa salina TaxID=215803 RepID=A0A0C2A0Z3_9BACT|nr:MBL fold metallo-hydrolase [Enhygromyxa salina]KIG17073.1 Metal-dependent hydrolase of the beta-lactamase superfamily III [Enhygromyxa salina]